LHGINIDKQQEFSLLQSEIKSAIKSLYFAAENKNCGKYIGICRDLNILSLCNSAGFFFLTVNLEKINCLPNNVKIPSNEELFSLLENKFQPYEICKLHNKLENNRIPMCAGVKAKFIADFLIKNEKKKNDNFTTEISII
jgi:hypothetical protein